MNKIISIFIAILLFFSISIPVNAADAFMDSNYEWSVRNANSEETHSKKATFYKRQNYGKSNYISFVKSVDDFGNREDEGVLDYYFRDIASDGNIYVALAHEIIPSNRMPDGSKGAIFVSKNGTDWTNLNLFFSDWKTGNTDTGKSYYGFPRMFGIAYANGRFVAVGESGVMYSSDGLKWDFSDNGGGFNSITWDGKQFVAIGRFYDFDAEMYKAVISVSEDGITWNKVNYIKKFPEAITGVYKIKYNNGIYIAYCSDKILYSKDTVTWEKATLPPYNIDTKSFAEYAKKEIGDVLYDGNKLIATRSDSVYISEDFKTWTKYDINKYNLKIYTQNEYSTIPFPIVHDMQSTLMGDNILYFGMGADWKNDNGLFVSSDGYSLTSLYIPLSTDATNICYVNNRIFALTYDGNIYTGTPKSEIPEEWAMNDINTAINKNIVPKAIQKNYRNKISRSDFCALIANVLEAKSGKQIDQILSDKGIKSNENIFSDTNEKAILAVNKLGIVNGKGEGIFDPDGSITRQEAAVILTNAAKVLGIDIRSHDLDFADSKSIATWAKDSVSFVSSKAIMGGVGENSFDPENTFTTQEAIITMLRLSNIK